MSMVLLEALAITSNRRFRVPLAYYVYLRREKVTGALKYAKACSQDYPSTIQALFKKTLFKRRY